MVEEEISKPWSTEKVYGLVHGSEDEVSGARSATVPFESPPESTPISPAATTRGAGRTSPRPASPPRSSLPTRSPPTPQVVTVYNVPIKFGSDRRGDINSAEVPQEQMSFPSYSDDGDDVAAMEDGSHFYSQAAAVHLHPYQHQPREAGHFALDDELSHLPRPLGSTDEEELTMNLVWDAATEAPLPEIDRMNDATSSDTPRLYDASALSLEDLNQAFASTVMRGTPAYHPYQQHPHVAHLHEQQYQYPHNVHPLKRMAIPSFTDEMPPHSATTTPRGRQRPPPYDDRHRRARSDTPLSIRGSSLPRGHHQQRPQRQPKHPRGTSTPPLSRSHLPHENPPRRIRYPHHEQSVYATELDSIRSKEMPPPPPPPPSAQPQSWQHRQRQNYASSRTDPLRSHKRYGGGTADDPYGPEDTTPLRSQHRSGSWSNLTLAYDSITSSRDNFPSEPVAAWRRGGIASLPVTPSQASADRKFPTLGAHFDRTTGYFQQFPASAALASAPHHRRTESAASTGANSVATDRSQVSYVSDIRKSEYFSHYSDTGRAQLNFPTSRVHLVMNPPAEDEQVADRRDSNRHRRQDLSSKDEEEYESGSESSPSEGDGFLPLVDRPSFSPRQRRLQTPSSVVPWWSPFSPTRRSRRRHRDGTARRRRSPQPSWPWQALDGHGHDIDELTGESEGSEGFGGDDPLPVGQLFQVAIPQEAYENYHLDWEDDLSGSLDGYDDADDADGLSLELGGGGPGRPCRCPCRRCAATCQYRAGRHQLPPCYYAMAVPDDLYRRVLDEIVLSRKMPCRLFFCGQYEDVDRPSIGIAVSVVLALLLLMGGAAWSIQS